MKDFLHSMKHWILVRVVGGAAVALAVGGLYLSFYLSHTYISF